MNANIEKIKNNLSENPDLCTRQLKVGGQDISMIFIKSTLDKMLFVHSVLSPLLEYKGEVSYEILQNQVIKAIEIELIEEDYESNLLKNKILLFIEQQNKALSIDLELIPMRNPEEPPTSPTINGPREGFTESVKTTTALIRKRCPSKDLVIKDFFVGNITNTQVCVYYIKGVADNKYVKMIFSKLQKIKTDGIIDSHYIMEFLSTKPKSMFDQFGVNEKPDIVCAKMLEGRIAIAVDGSPIVLTVPFMFFEEIQNSNDYYTNLHYATFIRYIRAIGLIMATVVPGVYLSLRLYHYKIIPLKFIVTINSTTQSLPFTPFIELLFILILFQILYEVSLRLPRYLGLATSIVGALVLGDTGVKAGLISPPGIIIIALSIISMYTVPNATPQFTILRFVFFLIGGTLGLFGIVGAMIYIVDYMNTLGAYHTPFLAPYAPRVSEDLKDGLHRKSIQRMQYRPHSMPVKNRDRKGEK